MQQYRHDGPKRGKELNVCVEMGDGVLPFLNDDRMSSSYSAHFLFDA